MQPKIKISKNGPYIVAGSIPLHHETAQTDLVYPTEWKRGKKWPQKESYALCRCGRSGNKPFCDNAHVNEGFDGTETAANQHYLSSAIQIEGPGVDLTDERKLCSGARFCDAKGGTWKLVETSDNPEVRHTVIQQACNCPSGRLVAWDKQTGKPVEPDFPQTIAVTQDPGADVSGPLWIKGGIPLVSNSGTVYEQRNRVTLCRCGVSENKPFCDGSHIKERFTDGHCCGDNST